MVSSSQFCDVCGVDNRPRATFCRKCGAKLQAAFPIQQRSVRVSGNATSTGLLVSNHSLRHRYLIIKRIGQGGMGAVYEAQDTQLGNRFVAVKEMSQSGLNQHEMLEASDAFKREAHMLASLQHPNLPSIYDHFSEAGRWYLVMSFIEGETLEEYLSEKKECKLPIQEVLDIGIQLCTVLDYLHTRQPSIIFRDLKPANVMRTHSGHLYLIDFGIARHFKPGQAKDTIAFGSPGYAAPEQYGKSQTGPHSDIYSLGAILHQLLSGNDPSQNPFTFVPIPSHGQTNIITLENLIKQMVTVDRNKRPSCIATIKQELQRVEAQLASQSSKSSSMAASRQSHSLSQPSPTPSKTRSLPDPLHRAVDNRPNSTRLPLTATRVTRPSPIFSRTRNLPDPLHRAVVNQPNSTQLPLTATRVKGQTPFICKGHDGMVWAVTWAPDGRHIASASDNGTVKIWDATSGKNTFTHHGHADKVNTVAWSPDGQYIASGSNDRTIQVWRVAHSSHNSTRTDTAVNSSKEKTPTHHIDQIQQGQNDATSPGLLVKLTTLLNKFFIHSDHSQPGDMALTPLHDTPIISQGENRTTQPGNSIIQTYFGHNSWVSTLAWSPNGQWIASGGGDCTVQVWNVATGETHSVYHGHTNYVQAVAWSPDGQYIASGSDDCTVKVWNISTGNLIFTYSEHSNKVKAITWSPDGERIASASLDRTVQIWSPLKRRRLFTYSGHSSGVNGVAWSPDDKSIASASSDKTILVWDTTAGYLFSSFDGHLEGVKAVAWSPDGQMIVSSSWDQTVRVWQVK